MSTETGVAWAFERHWRFYRGLTRWANRPDLPKHEREWVQEILPCVGHATPMYVSPQVDDAIIAAAKTFPLDALIQTLHLIQPYVIWLDRLEKRSLVQGPTDTSRRLYRATIFLAHRYRRRIDGHDHR